MGAPLSAHRAQADARNEQKPQRLTAALLEQISPFKEPASAGIRPLRAGPTGDPLDAPSFGQISLVKFVDISHGQMGGFGLDGAGAVWTWGYRLNGALGIPNPPMYYGGIKRIPFFTQNNIKIIEINASYDTRYALAATGEVYAWGNGSPRALGQPNNNNAETPQLVPGLPPIAHIFGSDSYLNEAACFALTAGGDLYAWGYNSGGQLGLGNTANAVPTQVPLPVDFTNGTRHIVKIALGEGVAILIDDLGDVWSAGSPTNGALGNGTTGGGNYTTFTMIDRSVSGMGPVIDVDTSYRRTVALDANRDVWEWGRTFGDTSLGSAVSKPTPQKIIISPAEIDAYGYTPVGQVVCAGESTCYFIDQYGRVWSWGSGRYYGFGREGGYQESSTQLIRSTAAEQWPKVVGDGDTQTNDRAAKFPVYQGGTCTPSANYLGYGFNALHPTIYDEKYMLKDAAGRVIDTDGDLVKIATGTTVDGVAGLTRWQYYKIGSDGKILSPATVGTPAINPTDNLWISKAFQPVPYIVKMDASRSTYTMLDSDGNIWKWGNDGSGSVAWGWDYEDKYDQNGSLTTGLYDRYLYEVMYMRGAPSIDQATLSVSAPVKVYTKSGEAANATASVSVHIPASTTSAELDGETIRSSVAAIKYVLVPYDPDNPDFTVDVSTMSNDDFQALYDAAAVKGNLLDEPLISGDEAQDIELNVPVSANGRLIVWATDERYVEGASGRDYDLITYSSGSAFVDSVYTEVPLTHTGIGEKDSDAPVTLYEPTADNIAKTNDDSADTGAPFDPALYGLPLDANGQVIGTTKDGSGSVTIAQPPTYGYDTVAVKSYEAAGDVGLPPGIKPYWRFAPYLDVARTEPQAQSVELEMTDEAYLAASYCYPFYYEQDPDYWTTVAGEKFWSDNNDALGLRPDTVTLTLKQYARDPLTGAQGAFIKDLKVIDVSEDAPTHSWPFDFGIRPSYEYTYEVVETAIPLYVTTVSYPHKESSGVATKEDLSGVEVLNTLKIKPVKFFKVDTASNPVVTGPARFELTNAEPGGKVLDGAGVEQDSLALETDPATAEPAFILPIQKPGTYYLTELQAPGGYRLLTEPIQVIIGGDGRPTTKLGVLSLEEASLSPSDQELYAGGFNVTNRTAGSLPAAGGIGTVLLTCAAGTFLVLAVTLVRTKRRQAMN